MYHLKESEPEMQTIHLYVVPERVQKTRKVQGKNIQNSLMACFACLLLFLFCCVPGNKLYTQKTLIVPAHVARVLTIQASATILPTGIRKYPAKYAYGTLTIYNGSNLVQSLPAGTLLTGSDGIQISTNLAITVPAANLPEVGIATVPAHALLAGSNGNIAPGDIQVSYASSIEIKNLNSFMGGKNSYSVRYITRKDTEKAATRVKAQLASQEPLQQLHRCSERIAMEKGKTTGFLSCQILTYHLPQGVQLLSYALSGNTVILTVNALVLPS